MENSFTEGCEPYYMVLARVATSVKLLPVFLVFWYNENFGIMKTLKVHPPFVVHEIVFN